MLPMKFVSAFLFQLTWFVLDKEFVLLLQNHLQESSQAAWWENSYDVVWWCPSVSRLSALYEYLFLLSSRTRLWSHWNLRRWNCSGRYALHVNTVVVS